MIFKARGDSPWRITASGKPGPLRVPLLMPELEFDFAALKAANDLRRFIEADLGQPHKGGRWPCPIHNGEGANFAVERSEVEVLDLRRVGRPDRLRDASRKLLQRRSGVETRPHEDVRQETTRSTPRAEDRHQQADDEAEPDANTSGTAPRSPPECPKRPGVANDTHRNHRAI